MHTTRTPRIVLAIIVAALVLATGLQQGRTQAAPAASVLYVDAAGTCGGASPCYATIQDAVDDASDGDEIRVASGSYTDLHTRGGTTQVLYVDKSLTLRGGYDPGDWDTPVWMSTVGAGNLGRCIVITGTITVTLERITITGGQPIGDDVENDGSGVGGGIAIFGSTVTISDAWFFENGIYRTNGLPAPAARVDGAGIYAENATLTVTG
ncbi:MAG: hypothetical protein JXD18_00640, partial [Anaerolineae bacterium]|nr:hypothetical protein [Anaerolineae bacterium]